MRPMHYQNWIIFLWCLAGNFVKSICNIILSLILTHSVLFISGVTLKVKRWLNLRNTTIILKYYIKLSSQKSLVVAVSRHVTLYCKWENYTTISSEPNCLVLNYVKCISESGRPNQHVKNMLYPMIMYRTKVLATTNAQQIPTMICYERMNIYIYIYISVFYML